MIFDAHPAVYQPEKRMKDVIGMPAFQTVQCLIVLLLALYMHDASAEKRNVQPSKPAAVAAVPTPPAVVRIETVLAAGGAHTLLLQSDGSLWGWGSNEDGQLAAGNDAELAALGIADTASKYLPMRIGTSYVAVSAGDKHTLAIKPDGSLWAWGSNRKGQIGDGTDKTRYRPVLVGQGFVKATAGSHSSFAIKADGSLWAWGQNDFGQLGDGSKVDRSEPVLIGNGYASVATGFVHTVALKPDGSLWAWGDNEVGQHGDGTTIPRDSQTQRWSPVHVGDGYKEIAAEGLFTMALKSDGSLWAWGNNNHGRVGDGSEAPRTSPVKVGEGFVRVAAGSHVLALKADGSLWSWGYNGNGQLGDGTKDRNRKSPAQIGSDFKAIATGGYHSVAVKKDDSVWAWGNSWNAVLGDRSNTDRYLPGPVVLPLPASSAGRPDNR